MKRLHALVSALAVSLAALSLAAASDRDGNLALTIDPQQSGPVISPLLFGHNLEVTRRAVWSGLSAEMVANRKFAAIDHGMPKRWWTMPGSHVEVDDKQAYAGRYAVQLETRAGEKGSGIWQQHDWLSFQKGRKYAFRVWIKSDADQSCSMRIMNRPFFLPIFDGTTQSQPGPWHLWSGEFTAPADAPDAVLELLASKPGTLWIGAVSIMPADHFHGMRRDVVNLLKTLKPGLLRWPGGCFAEYYPWQDGLLPVDQRPPVGPGQWRGLLPDSDDYDNHDIGTDEYLALCQELNCAPAITVRYGGGGSPEEAAAWVEYCNGTPATHWGKIRADRGHPQPYQVKYWFVGNEVWGVSLVQDKSAEACAVRSRLFAAAMKHADPTIRRIHCAPLDQPVWAAQTYQGIKQSNDFTELVQDGFYFPTADVTMAEVARTPTRMIASKLRGIRQALNQAASNKQQVGIAFYEWNVMWDRPGDDLSAIFAAGMLNLFCREAEPLGLELTGYFQPVSEGAIRVEPTASHLEPAGRVFALYAAHQGNRLLKTPGLTDEADLDLCASLTPDNQTIFITVLNRNPGATRTLELSVNHFSGRPEAAVDWLVPQSSDPQPAAKSVPLTDGKTLTLPIPPCGIARIQLGH